MARTRKSRPRARAAPATKPKTRARKAAARPKSGRAPDPLDGFVAAAAHALALPVEPQWLAAIRANLEVNLRMAAFVAEFALPDESEPAPVFRA
jgi:hypothetical protein